MGRFISDTIRLPLHEVHRVLQAVGEHFIIIYRLSMLDVVEGGSTYDNVVELGQAVEKAGATIFNTLLHAMKLSCSLRPPK